MEKLFSENNFTKQIFSFVMAQNWVDCLDYNFEHKHTWFCVTAWIPCITSYYIGSRIHMRVWAVLSVVFGLLIIGLLIAESCIKLKIREEERSAIYEGSDQLAENSEDYELGDKIKLSSWEKGYLVALALSLVVFLGWCFLSLKPFPLSSKTTIIISTIKNIMKKKQNLKYVFFWKLY